MSMTISDRAREFAALVHAGRDRLAAALPSHIPVERFERVVLTAVQANPELLKLNRQSLFMACLRAAQDGLLPDGRQGVIVDFGDQAQWMPMVGGLMMLARNSGQIKSLIAQVVHERDRFVWRPADTERPIEHEVPSLSEDRGKPIGAYAIASLVSGEVVAEVMSRAEIEQVRAASRTKKNGFAWSQWWGEMARKSVLRRLIKRLPLSTDRPGAGADGRTARDEATDRLVSAIERVDEDVVLDGTATEEPSEAPRSRLDALEAAIAEEAASSPSEGDDAESAARAWARKVISDFGAAPDRGAVLRIVDATRQARAKLLRQHPELHAEVEAARLAAFARTENGGNHG
jgi:recombination protein RecT